MKSMHKNLQKRVVLVIAMLTIISPGTRAAAQDDGSHNGLEGTWRAQLTVRDCQTGKELRTFPTLFEYAKGGTLTVTTAGQLPSLSTTGLGVWKNMYGHTYSAVSEFFIFDSAGAWTSTHRLTRVIELGSANGYTDTIALEILDTNGNLIGTGCATAVASRMK